MLHIGFTGTRHGMTDEQWSALCDLVDDDPALDDVDGISAIVAHHGDCVGADDQFHSTMGCRGARLIVHPGPLGEHSAGCKADERREPLPHMQRNRAIVAAADVMLAAPFEMEPQKRGGTWATIGFARRAQKPLAIVWRDGTVTKERWP